MSKKFTSIGLVIILVLLRMSCVAYNNSDSVIEERVLGIGEQAAELSSEILNTPVEFYEAKPIGKKSYRFSFVLDAPADEDERKVLVKRINKQLRHKLLEEVKGGAYSDYRNAAMKIQFRYIDVEDEKLATVSVSHKQYR